MAGEGQADKVDDEGRYIFDAPPEEPEEEEGEEEPEGDKDEKKETLVYSIDQLLSETDLSLDSAGCPLRTKSYGGIPSFGGFKGWVEYGVGAGLVAEAAHCILGSLGRMIRLDDPEARANRGHLAHIKEEMGIIEDKVKEYGRPVYTRQMREYDSAEEQVENIRETAPELKRRARRAMGQIDPDTPPRIRETAEATYKFLIVLSDSLLTSVRNYPEFDNAFQGQPVQTATRALSLAVDNLFDAYGYR